MSKDVWIVIIYFIGLIIALIDFFRSKRRDDSPISKDDYLIGGIVLCCAWPLIILFIPFFIFDKRKNHE